MAAAEDSPEPNTVYGMSLEDLKDNSASFIY